MPYEIFLAWRYFRARRKSLARFTATAAVLGIAAGVGSLIVAQALSRGFAGEIQEKILANTAHVTIFRTDGAEIGDWRKIKENLERVENVRAVAPTTYENAVLVSDAATSYAVVRGISDFKIPIENQTENGGSKIVNVAVGALLAEKTGLKVGDRAQIVTTATRGEFAPQNRIVRIGAIFRTGLYEYDSTWMRVAFEDLGEIYGRADFAPTVLTVMLADVYVASETAGAMQKILPAGYKVVDWQQANEPLFAALSLERKVTLAVISLIIFVAALNITTTLALLVNERKLDIAVLRTCGARARGVIFIFLTEGLFLGLLGTATGAGLGLAACFAANYFRLVSLPSEVYSLSFVPLAPHLYDVLIIVTAALAVCLLAAAYPAWRAARLKPLENLSQT